MLREQKWVCGPLRSYRDVSSQHHSPFFSMSSSSWFSNPFHSIQQTFIECQYVPDTVLGAEDIMVRKSAIKKCMVWWEGQGIKKWMQGQWGTKIGEKREDFVKEEVTLEQITEAQMWALQVDKGGKGEAHVIPGRQNHVKKRFKSYWTLARCQILSVLYVLTDLIFLFYPISRTLLLSKFYRRGNR